MKKTYVAAGASVLAAIAGGTAVAATSGDKQTESAIISDAAKQLGVKPDDLRQALTDAEKARGARPGSVLDLGHGGPGGPGGPPNGPHGFGPGGPGDPLLDLAKALGISQTQLRSQLESGKTITEIAKAEGKTLDEVKAALKQQATDRLDADLKAGRITQAQRDEELSELDERLSRLGDAGGFGPPPGGRDHGGPWGRHP